MLRVNDSLSCPESGIIQRLRNVCCGRIADITVPEAMRVDTDGGIKQDMAFLALLNQARSGGQSKTLPFIISH